MKTYSRNTDHPDDNITYQCELLEEDRVVQTRWGEATIAAGTWLIQDNEGFYFGMTPADFSAQFTLQESE